MFAFDKTMSHYNLEARSIDHQVKVTCENVRNSCPAITYKYQKDIAMSYFPPSYL